MTKATPLDIPKREVWEAFKKVKANQGAAGVEPRALRALAASICQQPDTGSRMSREAHVRF
jgi:hypothetical protein